MLLNTKLVYPILLLVLGLCYFKSNSQTLSPYVIASAGYYANNGNSSLSYTIGEPMVQTFYSNKNILTQGFHQPMDTLGESSSTINNIYSQAFLVDVYPNPFSDFVYIKIQAENSDVFTIEITNTLGQLSVLPITIEHISGTNTYKVATGNLAMGIYMLRITSANNNMIKSIKLNRTLY